MLLNFLFTYLALSGTTQGVAAANIKGALVPKAKSLQSSAQIANQGKILAAKVKNRAIDILATKVRHFGPTYSKTGNN